MGDYQQLLEIKRITPDWENLKLLKFERDVYLENEAVKARSDADVEAFRRERGIRVSGPAPKPVTSFRESQFPQYVLDVCAQEGFAAPTDVQCQAWPALMSGRDVVVVAKTGSGKTLAYILPAIPHIMSQPLLENGEGPICLVLCPTRELAVQIQHEAEKFLTPCRAKCTSLYGGVPKHEQAGELSRSPEVVVATPGRLLDHVDAKATNLFRVSFVVLDEADRMLGMGFEPFIIKIEALIRPDRQAALFSATLPEDIHPVVTKYLRDPARRVTINVGSGDGFLAPCSSVTQEVKVVDEDAKLATLAADLLQLFKSATRAARSYIPPAPPPPVRGGAIPPPPPSLPSVLVFCGTKARVDDALAVLKATDGMPPARALHGGMAQGERFAALDAFKAHTARVLVATSVMGRGIDIPSITHVYTVDFPSVIEDYIHRVGRTGRAGREGRAVSYLTRESYSLVPDLAAFLEESQQDVPQAVRDMLPAGRKRKEERDDAAAAAAGRAGKRPCLAGLDFAASSYDASLAAEPAAGVVRKAGVAGGTQQARSSAAAAASPPPPAFTTYYSSSPSAVLLLRNVVPPGGVDSELREDMWGECERISGAGEVLDVVIYEHKRWRVLTTKVPDEEIVRVFIKFRSPAAAVESYKVMHGRQFDGRTVVATFYDPTLFEEGALTPHDDEPKMTTTLMVRNMAFPEELDEDFIPDVVGEMSAFGQVVNCEVHVAPEEPPHKALSKEERVRVFVKFGSTYGAMQALVNIDGRMYNRREICAHLYDDVRADIGEFLPDEAAEPPLPIRCFISTEAPPML